MNEFIQEVDPAAMLLLSAFLPLFQAWLNRYIAAPESRALASFGVSVAAGVSLAFLMGMRDTSAILAVTAGVYGLSQVAYHGVVKPTGAGKRIEGG